MKKILIPTDLSSLGDYAYGLASVIASATGAKIEILSVVPGPRGAFYDDSGQLTNDEGFDYSEWDVKVKANAAKIESWISDKADISDYKVCIGNVDETILSYSEKNAIDLIVMGTEGLFEKSIWNKGSHAEYISNHSAIPILSLKCDRHNIDLSKILLVSDFRNEEKANLEVVKAIQHAYNSKLVLLHVKTNNSNRTDDEIADDIMDFSKTNELVNYSMHIYSDDSVEAGIAKFSAENDIDLIVLGSHQGFGISKLFKGSISDDVVNHLYHPILTYPLN